MSKQSLNQDKIISGCKDLAEQIRMHRDELFKLLQQYEGYNVALDEIEKSIDCLNNIESEIEFFNKEFDSLSVFLPLNLPLYSLILFAVVPSFIAKKVELRAPLLMRIAVTQIMKALMLEENFPHISLRNIDRNDFIENYVKKSEVVLFTGKYNNAAFLLNNLPKSTLFIYNGAGINPLVIHHNADLDLAVQKTIEVKTFNNGQDCAGPDAILLHKDIAEAFLSSLYDKLSELKVGDYSDKEVVIGKIMEPEQLLITGKLLLKNSERIVYGGNINFKKGIIEPTVILADLAEKVTYEELYAPVFKIFVYEAIEKLKLYFQHPVYLQNAMYVSIFGSMPPYDIFRNSIILENEIIIDVEAGNKEYGGYSKKASFVSKGGEFHHHPILVSREIDRYL